MKNKFLLLLALVFCFVLSNDFARAETNSQIITLKNG
jgi:hypothetical protein